MCGEGKNAICREKNRLPYSTPARTAFAFWDTSARQVHEYIISALEDAWLGVNSVPQKMCKLLREKFA